MRDVIEELRSLATHSEAEFTPNGDDWRAFDEMAVELEVAEFLYALVRLEKPTLVIESGAGKGYSTLAIAGALQRNGRGSLRSFEPEDEFRSIAKSRTEDIPNVTIYKVDTSSNRLSADMVFLDSGPLNRWQEILYWLDRPCTLVIHDAYRYDVLKRCGGNMHHCPRGLWVRTVRGT